VVPLVSEVPLGGFPLQVLPFCNVLDPLFFEDFSPLRLFWRSFFLPRPFLIISSGLGSLHNRFCCCFLRSLVLSPMALDFRGLGFLAALRPRGGFFFFFLRRAFLLRGFLFSMTSWFPRSPPSFFSAFLTCFLGFPGMKDVRFLFFVYILFHNH